jgi:prepilin-type N-terminal cleavage/methylation domain-containing protein
MSGIRNINGLSKIAALMQKGSSPSKARLKCKSSGQHFIGFTLLEVLVALGIVAVVAVLSWQGLQGVLAGVQGLQNQDRALQSALVVFAQLENDLATLHPLSNNPSQAAFSLNPAALELQGVWHGNALLPQAPQAKRIAWQWRTTGLERQVQLLPANPDNLSGLEGSSKPNKPPSVAALAPTQSVLFAGITGLQLRVLYTNGRWGPAQVFGQYKPLPTSDISLQGTLLHNEPSLGAPVALALEVALSTQTQHTWVRVLPLGAAMVAGQKEQP